MKNWYCILQGRDDYGWEQIYKTFVEADNKSEAIKAFHETIDFKDNEKIPQRIKRDNIKSDSLLLHVYEVESGHFTEKFLEDRICTICGKSYRLIDKFNEFGSYSTYECCSKECDDIHYNNRLERFAVNADHCFRWKSSQWDLPTKETYQQLINIFNINKWKDYKEYESLRQEYESLKYTYNNQKTHHSVWNYEIAEKIGHVTPKPLDLIKNIIKHSSDEGDLVLDCFAGSGTTGEACQSLNRNCVLIENDSRYIPIIEKRLNIKKINNI